MNVLSEYLKNFFVMIIIIFILIFAAFFFTLNVQVEGEMQNLILESQSEVESIRNVLESNILQLVKDSEIFGELVSYHNYLDESYIKDMTELFVDNVQLRKNYIQMRILDENGKEIVRVDRVNDIPISKTGNQLQDKSDRYYFKDIKGIANDEIYLSDLDLNVENGEIQVPFVPTLRSGKKIYMQDRVVGYLVLNYDIGELIDQIHRKNNSIYKSKIVVNDRGNFIFSNKAEDNWSFVFSEDSPSMSDKFPEIWSQINSHNRGYSEGDGWTVIYEKIDLDNLLVDNRIELSRNSKIKALYLIDYISEGHISILRDNIFRRNQKYLYIALSLGLIISAILANVFSRLSMYKKVINNSKTYDPLTGLYNRDMGLKRLVEKMSNVNKKKSILSISIIKMKNIKMINRKYGYSFGDDIIKELGKNILVTIESDDGDALRLSGNSFLVYMENVDYVKSKINMEIICEKINDQDISDKSLLKLQYGTKIIDGNNEQDIVEIIGSIEEEIKG
jgi:diguanylate cyclase (GGDEF)-like protein